MPEKCQCGERSPSLLFSAGGVYVDRTRLTRRSRPLVHGLAFILAILGLILVSPITAAPPKISGVKGLPRTFMRWEQDYIAPLAEVNSPLEAGSSLTVKLLSGKVHENMVVSQFKPGPADNTFRSLSFEPHKGTPSKLNPGLIASLETSDTIYDVAADARSKSYVLLNRKQRDEVAQTRLARSGDQLWTPPTEEEIRDATREYEKLFEYARADFPQLQFQRIETTYFVFFTDVPVAQVGTYIANLDKMYEQLCLLFGVPSGTNLWLGKCPIICFLHAEAYQQFETQRMSNPNSQGSAGLNHQWSDGRVVVTCRRGDDPQYLGVVLVHETAHGFLHRIRSSGSIPLWMNEGISDWIAAVVIPQSNHINSRMTEALLVMRQTGTLGGNFMSEHGRLDGWQYGVAATMTQWMLSHDSTAYRGLIMAIKEGYPWQEALELTYGLTPEQLVAAYGQAFGIPALRP